MNYKEIKTYEAACKYLKRNPKHLPGVTNVAAKHKKYVIANYKLVTIAEAINKIENFVPDFSDWNQWKYFPVFYTPQGKKSGFGFSYAYCVRSHSGARVGSRLCFSSREIAEYFGKKFLKLHKDVQLFT